MKCAKCGAELKEGCLYCSVCGHEAQMVNGYSVLEEDYLKALLTDEASKDTSSEETENQKKKAGYTSLRQFYIDAINEKIEKIDNIAH